MTTSPAGMRRGLRFPYHPLQQLRGACQFAPPEDLAQPDRREPAVSGTGHQKAGSLRSSGPGAQTPRSRSSVRATCVACVAVAGRCGQQECVRSARFLDMLLRVPDSCTCLRHWTATSAAAAGPPQPLSA
ncbi:hypothetical protein RKD46_000807 [Streptomyces pseudovenezuelae]|nr:hypothetical protein [Streptomyces sp. SAI-117]